MDQDHLSEPAKEKLGEVRGTGAHNAIEQSAGSRLARLFDALYLSAKHFLVHHRVIIIILALLALVVEEAAKGIIIEGIRELWHKQPTKIVLAVFPDTPTARPMADGLGFNDSRSAINLREGWRLEYMAESGSIEATDLALRKRLEDENVVLVVGHDSSSTVKELLAKVYRDTGIPLILPAVTNPDLTTVLQKSPTHILRLPPTDDRQVVAIRQLVEGMNPSSVALMVDNSNETYSSYIASQLIETGGTIPFVDSIGVGLGYGGFSPGSFLGSKPDVLVFIGMEVQADIFLRRLRHERYGVAGGQPPPPLKLPTLVFTDGVAGELFNDAAKGLLGAGTNIYVTCPLQPSRPKGQMLGGFPTYKDYAVAARVIIDELISGIGKGKASRESIIEQMQKMIESKSASTDFGGLKVKFDQHGNNVLGLFHVYEIKGSGVEHSGMCSCI